MLILVEVKICIFLGGKTYMKWKRQRKLCLWTLAGFFVLNSEWCQLFFTSMLEFLLVVVEPGVILRRNYQACLRLKWWWTFTRTFSLCGILLQCVEGLSAFCACLVFCFRNRFWQQCPVQGRHQSCRGHGAFSEQQNENSILQPIPPFCGCSGARASGGNFVVDLASN